jgi:phosphoribosylglycinamide formyltransferase 1
VTRKSVAILISGGGSNMEALVRAMQARDFPAEPSIVISNNPDAGGLEKAERLGVATEVIDHREHTTKPEFESALAEAIEASRADIVCLAGFMRVLSSDFIARFENRILNIHPSLLPLFRGLHTHDRALEAGVAVHGCTVHLVIPELDAGQILGQAVVPVMEGDTAETLAARVLKMEHRLYPAVLAAFARGETTPIALFDA